ncbi:DUF6233 domain-containing protein [Streptomyces sp. NPDC003042]
MCGPVRGDRRPAAGRRPVQWRVGGRCCPSAVERVAGGGGGGVGDQFWHAGGLAAQRRPRSDPSAGLIERGIGAGQLPVRVHAGDCRDTGKRCAVLNTEEARRALAEGVPGCIHCRPDVVLGMLE